MLSILPHLLDPRQSFSRCGFTATRPSSCRPKTFIWSRSHHADGVNRPVLVADAPEVRGRRGGGAAAVLAGAPGERRECTTYRYAVSSSSPRTARGHHQTRPPLSVTRQKSCGSSSKCIPGTARSGGKHFCSHGNCNVSPAMHGCAAGRREEGPAAGAGRRRGGGRHRQRNPGILHWQDVPVHGAHRHQHRGAILSRRCHYFATSGGSTQWP